MFEAPFEALLSAGVSLVVGLVAGLGGGWQWHKHVTRVTQRARDNANQTVSISANTRQEGERDG